MTWLLFQAVGYLNVTYISIAVEKPYSLFKQLLICIITIVSLAVWKAKPWQAEI